MLELVISFESEDFNMNKQMGKLATLGGFGVLLLMAFYNFARCLGELIGLGLPQIPFNSVISGIMFLACAAGFGIAFLSEQNIFDLAIAGGLGIYGVFTIFQYDLYMWFPVQTISVFSMIVMMIEIAAIILWAMRFRQRSILLTAAMSSVRLIIILVITPILSSISLSAYYVGTYAASLIMYGIYAFAAYLDYCEG